jgi:hypothetical protein
MGVEIQLFECYAQKELQIIYIQGVLRGVVNILGDDTMDYFE